MFQRNMLHPSSGWMNLVQVGDEVIGMKEHASYMGWLRDF
jgi:hypothetical protein